MDVKDTGLNARVNTPLHQSNSHAPKCVGPTHNWAPLGREATVVIDQCWLLTPCETGNESFPVRVLRSSQDLHIKHKSEVYVETTGHSRRLGMPTRGS